MIFFQKSKKLHTFLQSRNNISTVNLIAGKSDTNLQLNVNNSTFGQSNKIKVNLTNGNGLSNKTINFNINGTNYTSNTNVTTDSGGIAVFNYTPPHAGNYMVSAVFSGDVDYNPSSNSDNFSVFRMDTSLKLNPISNITFGSDVNINSTLTAVNGTPLSNKTINFNINGTNYTYNTNVTTDSDGVVVFNYTPPHAGNYVVSAVFSGGIDYNPSSNSDNFSVFRMDTNLKLNSIGSVAFGGGVGDDATLIGGSGMPKFSVNSIIA